MVAAYRRQNNRPQCPCCPVSKLCWHNVRLLSIYHRQSSQQSYLNYMQVSFTYFQLHADHLPLVLAVCPCLSACSSFWRWDFYPGPSNSTFEWQHPNLVHLQFSSWALHNGLLMTTQKYNRVRCWFVLATNPAKDQNPRNYVCSQNMLKFLHF